MSRLRDLQGDVYEGLWMLLDRMGTDGLLAAACMLLVGVVTMALLLWPR